MASEQVSVGARGLAGELHWQPDSLGVVVFAHGSGADHPGPRDRHVAEVLHGYRLATLLTDLLTDDEAHDAGLAFDIALLSARLTETIAWIHEQPGLGASRLALFGASTGAAAAFVASARQPARISAIVARSGRPDLAGDALPGVLAPTLLIVGGDDLEVLRHNRQAVQRLSGRKRLEVVPGASHRFVEPGTLDTVAHLAGAWFQAHLSAGLRG